MIRVNIDTAKKLVNGVVGTVKRIDLDTGNGIGSDVHVYSSKDVRKVHIKFDNDFVGEAKKHSCSHICKFDCELIGTVPIYSIEKEFLSNKNNRTWVKRYQFPFVLCWACTVHKVQGLTLNSAYINIIGNKKCCWQPGMFYTAISRLTSLDGLKQLKLIYDFYYCRPGKGVLSSNTCFFYRGECCCNNETVLVHTSIILFYH